MKRLLIVATLALGALAGSQTQAKAEIGFGIGIGLSISFSGSKKCDPTPPPNYGYGYPGAYGAPAMGGMPGMPPAMAGGYPAMPPAMAGGYPGMPGYGGMNPMAMAPGYGGMPGMGMPFGGFNPTMAGMSPYGMSPFGGMGIDPMTAMALQGYGGVPNFGGMQGFGGMPTGLAGLDGFGGMNGVTYGQPILVSVDYGDNQPTNAAPKPATVKVSTPATNAAVVAAAE